MLNFRGVEYKQNGMRGSCWDDNFDEDFYNPKIPICGVTENAGATSRRRYADTGLRLVLMTLREHNE